MTQPNTGAQGGTDGTQSGAGTGQGSDPNQQTDTGTQSGTDTGTQTGSQTQTGANNSNAMTLEQALAELERQRARTSAADQNQAKLAAELKKFQDAQLTAEEKTKRDLEEAQKVNSRLEEENKRLKLQTAFLADPTYKWRNPDQALRLVDLSEVKIGDDGKVTGLKDAAKALAESSPYLLNTEPNNDNDSNNGQPAGATAGPNNNGGRQTGASKAGMAARFPAMRTRGLGA